MAHELRYSRRALADLDGISSYIARESPGSAADVVTRLNASIAILADFPLAGRRTERAGVRMLTSAALPFRVFYLLRPNLVVVLHVRHTARRPA